MLLIEKSKFFRSKKINLTNLIHKKLKTLSLLSIKVIILLRDFCNDSKSRNSIIKCI